MSYLKLFLIILSLQAFAGESVSIVEESKHDVYLLGIGPDNMVFGTSTEIVPFHLLAEADPTETFVWNPQIEEKTIIDFLPGYTLMTPRKMNKMGWLIGEATSLRMPKAAFIWTEKNGTKKLPLVENSNSATAQAISDNEVGGWVSTDDGFIKPVIWTKVPSGWSSEVLPQESNKAYIRGMSDNGKFAVGEDGGRPVIWEKVNNKWQREFLGTGMGTAKFVNNQGLVAGNLNSIENVKGSILAVSSAFYCEKDKKIKEIGTFEGHHHSKVTGINNNGVILGISFDRMNSQVFAWTKLEGMNTINGLEIDQYHVTGINDQGFLSVNQETKESVIRGLVWKSEL